MWQGDLGAAGLTSVQLLLQLTASLLVCHLILVMLVA